MRTTIDLPDELHGIAVAIARDRGTTLSATIADLMCRALGRTERGGPRVEISERTGRRVIRLGHPVTPEDVRALDDEE